MKSSRNSSPCFQTLVFALTALLAVVAPLSAQPSGGGYGPVAQTYEVPQAPRVFYVAPGGDVAAPGNAADRPTTLERAISEVTTGDAIILRGGIYRTGSLVLNQGVTLQPFADERPVLKGTHVATQWQPAGPNRWRTTWTRLFPARPADWWREQYHTKDTPVHLFNNDMVFVDGEPLNAVATAAEVTAQSYAIDYENGIVTIGTDPANRTVEITAHDSALIRTFRDAHGKRNDRRGPVIRGLTFTQYAYRALEVEGVEPQKHADPSTFGKEVVGTVLENLTISHCSRVAGYFRGDNLVIRHCLVSDCGTEGIYVINSADMLLEKNIVTRTNSAERLQGYYASAVKIFNQSYRAVVRDNLIIDNPHASGVWYDVGEVDGVFVNNWVERTNDGFFFEISKGALVAGNVFVNCTPGTRVLNSSNVRLYQNTYYNSTAAFNRDQRGGAHDHFGWHVTAGPDVHEREGHEFVNNLAVADATFKEPLVQFWQSPAVREKLTQPQAKRMDGNVYLRQGATASPLIFWSPVANERGSVDIFAAEALRPYGNFDAQSRFDRDYAGPLFVSAELHRFELAEGFPYATAGLPLPDDVRQALGWTADRGTFPGAYAPGRAVKPTSVTAPKSGPAPLAKVPAPAAPADNAPAVLSLAEQRVAAAELLALGARRGGASVGSVTDVGALYTTLEAQLRGDAALQQDVVRRSYRDAFGREATAQELAAARAQPGTYAQWMARHVDRLRGNRAEYEQVLQRVYPFVIWRDIYPEEIGYWAAYDAMPYVLLVGALDDWARRNQPGLMVTAGKPTLSVNCPYLTTLRLSPQVAAEARTVLRLPEQRIIAPGAGQLTSAGGVHLVVTGR